jgi:DNA-binding CsgD family transcriptional regulator
LHDGIADRASANLADRATSDAVDWRAVLDWLDVPMAVVTHEGSLVFANRAAWAGSLPGLREWLCPAASRLDPSGESFRRARERLGVAARTASALTFDGRTVAVALCRLPEPAHPTQEVCYLVVAPPGRDLDSARLREFVSRHRITAAEARVLRGLLAGLRPQCIASRASVSLSTVRSQIRALLTKSNVNSVAALLGAVERIPPVRPADGGVPFAGDGTSGSRNEQPYQRLGSSRSSSMRSRVTSM